MRLAGYDIRERLARSDVLDIHEAWSHERGCSVIIKSLRPDRRGDAAAARALRREGRLLRRFSHPHLVRAYEVLADPMDAVVLETLGGETLAHLVRRRDRRLSAVELGFLAQHLCSAVGYLHRQGYLHLDLKPSNVVADGGRAKLIDLSIARRPGRARAGVGTWCYLAPEQAAGGHVDTPADVWGIGGVLWEAATGTCAFGDERDEDRELPVLHRRADSVRSLRPRLPARSARRSTRAWNRIRPTGRRSPTCWPSAVDDHDEREDAARRDDEHAGQGERGVAAGRHGVAAATELAGAGHAEHAHRRREAQPDRRGERDARELQQVLDRDGGDHVSAAGIGWRSLRAAAERGHDERDDGQRDDDRAERARSEDPRGAVGQRRRSPPSTAA